jgi:uncharacterized protein (DUF2267 family)
MNDDYERFVTTVQQQASLSREDAERAARATLQTLAERLSKGEARDLASQLPPPAAGWLFTDSDAQRFDAPGFLRRVAEREGVDVETAERHARAVFTALGRAASKQEIADMVAELPQDFSALVAGATDRFAHVVTAEAVLRRIADRAGVWPQDARAIADAVLEVLAERIAAGEVDDLIALMPLELRAPLERGKGKAARMPLDEFVRRVAEREGVELLTAREHVAAVLATLRELLPDAEWRDVTAQLPADYDALARA